MDDQQKWVKDEVGKLQEPARTVPEPLNEPDPLHPPLTTLVKLGSIAVHVDELMSLKGHEYDRVAIEGLLKDPEVVAWLAAMGKQSFLPVKR